MREMKDSGIEWVGAMPRAWKMNTIAQIFLQVKCKNTGLQEKNLLSLSYGKVKRKSIDTVEGLLPESFDGYNIIEKDDIVLRLTDLQNDHTSLRVGLAEERGIITSAYLTIRNRSNFCPKYLYYYMHSFDIAKGFYGMGAGVRQGLNWDGVKWLKILAPSVPEQERIAAFLDAECAEIDTVLEKTRASIEEYKKLKQAVITQAVTKGIRGDRPMKDSGIEWIGTCPLNWTICRIKNVIFPQEKEVLPDDEIITCFRDGEVTLRKNRREDGFTVSFTEHGYHGVDKGDLVIHGMDAFAGAIGCSDSRGKTTPVVHTCKTAGNNRFFMYFLRSMAYGNILMDLSNGVRIRSSDFRNFAKLGVFGAVMPPLEEQNEIVDYIDGIVIQMDRLIQKKENLLTEIENYKKSLIYEYVTGKKEVV